MVLSLNIFIGILTGYIINIYDNFNTIKEDKSKWLINILLLCKNKKCITVILSTVVIFLAIYFKVGYLNSSYFEYIFIVSILEASALIDIKTKKIPNKLMLLGLIGICIFILINFNTGYLLYSLIGIIVTLVVLAPISIISKGQFGMGDVKLFTVTSGILGIYGIMSCLFYSTMIASLVGVFLMFVRKKDKKSVIPLAPFILIGTLLTILIS